MKFEYKAVRTSKDKTPRHSCQMPMDNATHQDRLDIAAYGMAFINRMLEHGKAPIRLEAVDAETGSPMNLTIVEPKRED